MKTLAFALLTIGSLWIAGCNDNKPADTKPAASGAAAATAATAAASASAKPAGGW